MPPIETAAQNQDVVVWCSVSIDRYNNPILTQPMELLVRWEKHEERTFSSESKTIVYSNTVMVDIDLPVGTIFWEGLLADWVLTPQAELYEVVGRTYDPDVKGVEIRKQLHLRRFRGTLPQVV